MCMNPLGDQRSGTRKTLVRNFTPQAGLIRAARREAGLGVRDIRIDFPNATIAALVEGEGLGPDPTTYGLGIETTRRSNRAEGLPLGKAGLHLGSLRHPLGGASGIVLGPGASNNFDPWVLTQPRRDGLGGTLRQEINRPTAFEIDQDRPKS
jgi:hypothetical protein